MNRTLSLREILDVDMKSLAREDRHYGYATDGGYWHAHTFKKCGQDGVWLNIKLANDGFVYEEKRGEFIKRYKGEKWVRLSPKKGIERMPFLQSQIETFAESTAFYYEAFESRVDIKIWSNDPKTKPHVIITYEEGIPEYQDPVRYRLDSRTWRPGMSHD